MKICNIDQLTPGQWDSFCENSLDAWFWHTTKWLDYCLSYGSEKYQSRNLSFSLADQTGLLAICPLLLENRDGHNEFSTAGGGFYCAAPAFRNELKEDRIEQLQRLVFDEIDRLAQENRVRRVSFRLSSISGKAKYNWLLKHGYLDASLNTQVIDLHLSKETLWSMLRKGHKYDVNRGRKYYQVSIYDHNNADKMIFDQYRLLHHKAAGRVTRPIDTFEMMYRWMLEGEGLLCGVSRDNSFIGFSYISLYKNSAYYSSASDDPEYQTNIPISHVIQWSVIEWLKEHGYDSYEIGVQQFGPLAHDVPSAKDLSISFFKRGFGGQTVPLFRAEKYYDRELMKQTLRERMERLFL